MSALKEHTWRLLNTGFSNAAMNMAIDEAMLVAHSRGLVPPTLRFYGWQPPAVSIGYNQRLTAEVNLEACRNYGIDAVRRLTGGRAILHQSEVTYSVVIREELLPGSILDTYQTLAQGLVAGLRTLDIPAELAAGDAANPGDAEPGERSPACFDAPSAYEVVVHGAKVVGSAQARRDGTILQHGSILMDISPETVYTVLVPPEGGRAAAIEHLGRRAVGVRQALELDLPWTEVRDAVLQGFTAALDLTLQTERLTPDELETARDLAARRYGSADWNLRR